jgi:alpha-beta hydrolase superfamily lysophospholipase
MGLAALAASLTVGQKAALAVAVGLLALAVLVGVTAALTSLRVALLVWLGAAAALLLAAFLAPLRTGALGARPDPAADHDAAVARFHAAAEPSPEPLNPLCHPALLTHGRRTPTAVVLLHGISSCPRAFVDFAPALFARGHNVVALRMPENGYADRATDALRRLTAESLRDWGDLAVDIGAGLGEEVVVLGISAGGTVAAWAVQNRPEVSRAVLAAPMLGLANLGPLVNAAIMRVTLFLPDFSIWKDPVLRERYVGMPHAYKRQSSRATGEILRLGQAVRRAAEAGRPAGADAALVTNANDTAIDNGLAGRLADAWAGQGLPVVRFVFPKADGLGHELIDPLEPGADPSQTYPVLVALIEGRDPPSPAAPARGAPPPPPR